VSKKGGLLYCPETIQNQTIYAYLFKGEVLTFQKGGSNCPERGGGKTYLSKRGEKSPKGGR